MLCIAKKNCLTLLHVSCISVFTTTTNQTFWQKVMYLPKSLWHQKTQPKWTNICYFLKIIQAFKWALQCKKFGPFHLMLAGGLSLWQLCLYELGVRRRCALFHRTPAFFPEGLWLFQLKKATCRFAQLSMAALTRTECAWTTFERTKVKCASIS